MTHEDNMVPCFFLEWEKAKRSHVAVCLKSLPRQSAGPIFRLRNDVLMEIYEW